MSPVDVEISRKAYAPFPGTLETPENSVGHIVLLLHGIFVDRSENGRFDRLAPILTDNGYASLRVDLSGHGSNPLTSARTSVSQMSCDVLDTIAWAKQHGFEKISIVASSFSGALVSLALAYAPTPQLEKLIFLNPVLDFQNVFTSAATAEMAAIFSSENQLAAFKNGSFYPVPHFEMTREFIMDLKSINVQQAYQNITIPHLVVHGTADELVSFERAEEVTKSNKNSTFLAIEGGMHAFTISGHEAQIQEIIIDWLRA